MVLWGMFLVMSPWGIYTFSLKRKQKHINETKACLVLAEDLTTGHQTHGPSRLWDF